MNDIARHYYRIAVAQLLILMATGFSVKGQTMRYNSLTPEEERIIVHKGTERPWSGIYLNHRATGIYTCKRCDAPLFRSQDKFDSHCGWPSFDAEIAGAVTRIPDPDGQRTEIQCARCGAHLGHVFEGEGFTSRNVRHCVNSIALNFTPAATAYSQTATAVFAAGCFWGVEHHFRQLPGVLRTTVGYTGGHLDNPTYDRVCDGTSGHKEAVEVIFNPLQVSYETLVKLFFEIHDFTQTDGQGPDLGEQYRSYIFYADEVQRDIAAQLIRYLEARQYRVATRLEPASVFWPAETYHQDYYAKTGKRPYCHLRRSIF